MYSTHPDFISAEIDYRLARARSSRQRRRRSRTTYASWMARNRISDAR